MISVKDMIQKGILACEDAKVYGGFARFLMLELFREANLDMYALIDEPIDEKIKVDYEAKLKRLCMHEPMGYVLGYEWFYGYKIFVNEDVLIPRQETEELVGHVLSYIDEYYQDPKIVDVGCGSGAIAIALAKELNTSIIATDISEKALKMAKQNATYQKVELEFLKGDMLEPLIKENIKVDVLVCNPPYIKTTEPVMKSVIEYEPHVALFGGDDGLFYYRKVLENAKYVLNEKGMIAFEIDFDIAKEVSDLATLFFPQAKIEVIQDINKLDRIVVVKLI